MTVSGSHFGVVVSDAGGREKEGRMFVVPFFFLSFFLLFLKFIF